MKWKASISRMDYEFLGPSNLLYLGDSTSFETSLDIPYDRNLLHSNYINVGFANRKICDTIFGVYKTTINNNKFYTCKLKVLLSL